MNRDEVLKMINTFIISEECEMNRVETKHKHDTDPTDIEVNKDMTQYHNIIKNKLYELQNYIQVNLK